MIAAKFFIAAPPRSSRAPVLEDTTFHFPGSGANDPDPAAVHDGIAGHIRRFWDPRMRRALLQHIDAQAGQGCRPAVLAAIAAHREHLTPR